MVIYGREPVFTISVKLLRKPTNFTYDLSAFEMVLKIDI